MVSLALDELTDVTSTTPLFMQGDNAKFEVTEELAFVEQTIGKNIFKME